MAFIRLTSFTGHEYKMASFGGRLFPSADEERSNDSNDGSSQDRGWLKNISFTSPPPPVGREDKPGSSSIAEAQIHKVNKTHKHKRRESPVAPPPATKVVLDSDPTRGLYRIDERPDASNLTYESLYSGDVASYRRRFECLGLTGDQAVVWTDGRSTGKVGRDKKVKQLRYFSGSAVTQSVGGLILPNVAADGGSSVAAEFISLEQSEGVSAAAAKDSSDEFTVQKYMSQCAAEYNHSLLEQPQNVSLWQEFIVFQDHMLDWEGEGGERLQGRRHRALLERKAAIYERAIESNPRSVELLVGHMSILVDLWEPERVLQRWKDLVFRLPNKPLLWLGYILFCQTQFSSFTTSSLISLYSKSITTLTSIASGVLKSHLPEPDTMASVLLLFSLYCDFLKQVGHTERAVACYQALIEFNLCSPTQFEAKEVPFKEQVEFFETFWDSGVPRFGEPGACGWHIWMSGAVSPPLGLMESKRPEAGASDEGSDPEMELVAGQSLHRAWLLLEDYRRIHQALPWRPDERSGEAEDDPTDPDRMVLFDDVSHTLFRITDPDLRLQLVLTFLQFLGAPSPSPTTALAATTGHSSTLVDSPIELSPCFDHTLGALVSEVHCVARICHQPLGVGCLDDSLAAMTSLSDIGATLSQLLLDPSALLSLDRDQQVHCLISNSCNHAISLFSSDVTAQTTIAQVWAAFEVSQVASELRQQGGGGMAKRTKGKVKSVQKLFRSLLRLEPHRNNVSLWQSCALLEHLVGNFSEAVRMMENVLSQQPSSTLYIALCECVMGLRHSLMSCSPLVNTELALHTLVCMCEGKYAPMAVGEPPSPARVLRAKALIEKSTSSEMELNSDSLNTVLCHAYMEYLTKGLRDACKVLDRWTDMIVSRLCNGTHNKDHLLSLLQLSYSKQVCLIAHHSLTESVPPAMLRTALEKALDTFPSNSLFLSLYVTCEQQSFISGRLRRFFDTQSSKNHTPTLWGYSLTAELARYSRLLDTGVGITEESPIGTVNRVLSLLSRAVSSEGGQHCPLLWRLYMAVMAHTNPGKVKPIFYQAIHSCPWAKVLYSDGVVYLPGELERVMEVIEEKEIRVNAPLEETRLLQKLIPS